MTVIWTLIVSTCEGVSSLLSFFKTIFKRSIFLWSYYVCIHLWLSGEDHSSWMFYSIASAKEWSWMSAQNQFSAVFVKLQRYWYRWAMSKH